MIALYLIGLISLFSGCYLIARGLEYILQEKLEKEDRHANLSETDENE